MENEKCCGDPEQALYVLGQVSLLADKAEQFLSLYPVSQDTTEALEQFKRQILIEQRFYQAVVIPTMESVYGKDGDAKC